MTDTRSPDARTGPRDPHNVAEELQNLLLGADGVDAFLADVARAAIGTVASAFSCGITVRSNRPSGMFGATSDEFAATLDAIQYDVDDGPCLTCVRTVQVVSVEDIGADPRWPAFASRGRQVGAGSSLSVPLKVRDGAVGALNLYSRQVGAVTEADRLRAQEFADQAAGAVALALRLREREERTQHLEAALSSRSVIDQAIGILIAQTHVTPNEAFELLRVRSQHSNQKLRDVAARLVEQTARSTR
jgi:GAF domain-containing protein